MAAKVFPLELINLCMETIEFLLLLHCLMNPRRIALTEGTDGVDDDPVDEDPHDIEFNASLPFNVLSVVEEVSSTSPSVKPSVCLTLNLSVD